MVGFRSRVALWVMTAVLTTAATVTAVNALATDNFSDDSLNQAHTPYAQPTGEPVPTTAPVTPPASSTAAPSTGPATPNRPSTAANPGGAQSVDGNRAPDNAQKVTTGGGIIVAACANGKVTMYSWTPAPGYRAIDPQPGPASTAGVRFAKGSTELRVTLSCENGRVKPRFNLSD